MVTPLAGITVLELGTMITASLAGMMLADLGAEVIKVERPPDGDPFRSFEGSLYSPHFVAFNRNKRSVMLDLQTVEGRSELLRMVDTADVLLDNYRPGVLERLGLTAAVLKARNPRLVHCSITGFGEAGPYRNRPSYDTVGSALSGIASMTIDADSASFPGPTVSDNVTGMYAAFGIVSALFERGHTGTGRRLEINMLEASAAFIPDAFMRYEMRGTLSGPLTRMSASQGYVVVCRDRKLLAIHLSSQPKFWSNLLEVIGSAELAADSRYKTRMERIANYRQLSADLNDHFGRRDRSEWLQRLEKIDIPFAPVQNVQEVMQDLQLNSLGSFRKLQLPDGRSIRSMQFPMRFDGERATPWSAPPQLGEHTAQYVKSQSPNNEVAPEKRTS